MDVVRTSYFERIEQVAKGVKWNCTISNTDCAPVNGAGHFEKWKFIHIKAVAKCSFFHISGLAKPVKRNKAFFLYQIAM